MLINCLENNNEKVATESTEELEAIKKNISAKSKMTLTTSLKKANSISIQQKKIEAMKKHTKMERKSTKNKTTRDDSIRKKEKISKKENLDKINLRRNKDSMT